MLVTDLFFGGCTMDRAKLTLRIKNADIPGDDRDILLRRLSVASHQGVAAVMRDFEVAIKKRRIEVLQSHRRGEIHRIPSRNKRMVALHHA